MRSAIVALAIVCGAQSASAVVVGIEPELAFAASTSAIGLPPHVVRPELIRIVELDSAKVVGAVVEEGALGRAGKADNRRMTRRDFVNGGEAACLYAFDGVDLGCGSQLDACLDSETGRRGGAKVFYPDHYRPAAFEDARFLERDLINVEVWPQLDFGHLFGVGQSILRVLVGSDSRQHRTAGVVDAQEQTDGARYAKEELPSSPLSSIASAVRSLPLGAKVLVASIPIWPAWPIFFRGLDYFDRLGRRRNRRRAGLLIGSAISLFGASFCLWSWVGS